MSRILYPVMDAIAAYGVESFAALVRENLVTGLENVQIEILDDANFYRTFTFAYIAAAMTGNSQDFVEELGVDNVEPLDLYPNIPGIKTGAFSFDNDEVSGFSLDSEINDLITNDINTWVLPFSYNSTEADTVEVVAKWMELLNVELLSETGMVSVIRSMFPGRFIDYKGVDLYSMVIECEL
ncbi:hypothetical protein PHOBOS_14 [Erwinia phage vB_EamM_Phobos]|uniref:hypothetical protein n=1 Tax=Erwinia phage vB_EamM_Phobos TaxID=1883377 RepID=UPI00081C4CCE|nr:hypothetical protein BIZ79_gp014 [Erwinia phage vB_EamM_Phobos]ANZ50204.1 hypothetical protein PHOBOS_14 [Erwinia phage vB_EamM_Phobos]